MKFDPNKHHRRSIRLKGYDYSQPGAYFITLCTYHREILFGEIVDGIMVLNPSGEIFQNAWDDLPNHYPHVVLDELCIMPNHIHGIIVLDDSQPCRGGSQTRPYDQSTRPYAQPNRHYDPTHSNDQTRPYDQPTRHYDPIHPNTLTRSNDPTHLNDPIHPHDPIRPHVPTHPYNGTHTDNNTNFPKRHALPEIVRALKSFSSRRINQLLNSPGTPVWQRNYYEHIVRDQGELHTIRGYIRDNPLKWDLDQDNPVNLLPDNEVSQEVANGKK